MIYTSSLSVPALNTYLAVVGRGLEVLGVELPAALHLPQLQLQRDVALLVMVGEGLG